MLELIILFALAILYPFISMEGPLALDLYIIFSMLLSPFFVLYLLYSIKNLGARLVPRTKMIFNQPVRSFGYETVDYSVDDPYPRIIQFKKAWAFLLFLTTSTGIFLMTIILLIFNINGYLLFPYLLFEGITSEQLLRIILIQAVYAISISIFPIILISKDRKWATTVFVALISGFVVLLLQSELLVKEISEMIGVSSLIVVFVMGYCADYIKKWVEKIQKQSILETPAICPHSDCKKKLKSNKAQRCEECNKIVRCYSCGAFPWDEDWDITACPICGNDPNTKGDSLILKVESDNEEIANGV
jgi:hypothetical protein